MSPACWRAGGGGLLRRPGRVLQYRGEFGRTPLVQGVRGRQEINYAALGRGHNPYGWSLWLAGGGVKAGYRHGATDPFGFQTVEGRVHVHDLHATLLNLLGLDHERLTYRHAGRDFRLDRKSTRLNSSHIQKSRMPSSA